MRTRSLALASVLIIGLAGAECSSDDKALFARAEELYRNQDYDDAAVLFKRYLVQHPRHSGAHLYLGARLGTTAPPWLRADVDEKLREEQV